MELIAAYHKFSNREYHPLELIQGDRYRLVYPYQRELIGYFCGSVHMRDDRLLEFADVLHINPVSGLIRCSDQHRVSHYEDCIIYHVPEVSDIGDS